MKHKLNEKGFSLVELSIVLVILGLLTGGILTGQSLIRAAELRAVTTEYSSFQTAVNTFQQKYFAIPGDITNATSFWGSAGGNGNIGGGCETTTGTGTQTCNGNGNGRHEVSFTSPGNRYEEMFTFWQHLANSGLINGTFSGKSGAVGGDYSVLSVNVPASKISGAGWSTADDLMPTHGASPNTTYYGTYDGGWMLTFGAQSADHELANPVLTPDEAWNIDKKMDDGHASQGIVIIDRYQGTSSNCRIGPNPQIYRLNHSGKSCALLFRP